MVQLTINPCDRYAGSIIVAVTYGDLADGNEGSYLARAHVLADLVQHIVTPEKAAMFTTFPFRECLCRRHHCGYLE
jgi:hypothetical protein